MPEIGMNAKVVVTIEKGSSRGKDFVEESALTRLMGLAIGGIGFFLIALKLLDPY